MKVPPPLQQFQPSRYITGFTLTELLVAAMLTGIVVSALGYGLVVLMGVDRRSQVQSERQMEISRALSYITNDIREAKLVANPAAAPYTVPTSAPASCAAGGTPVLHLKMPDGKNKVYYLNDISPCSSPGPPVWLRPGVIVLVENTGSTTVPDTWTIPATVGKELVDAVQNPIPKLYADQAALRAAICPASVGTLTGSKGFYACIENARTVSIYIFGRGAVTGEVQPAQSTRIFTRGS
jgi:type II secretory pathway pseudopilin PulG